MEVKNLRIIQITPFLVAICLANLPAQAQYSGGTGEPNDPYQIATAEDLMLLGETTEDYDKHFILTDDIDLDPNLPGRKVFDKAVIAPDTDDVIARFQGTSFTGVFEGNGHIISHLTIEGVSYLALFGKLSGAMISNLGLESVDINGNGEYIGSLVGLNRNIITKCYSTGAVTGGENVGGLVGVNVSNISQCYSTCMVNGQTSVGCLVGYNLTGDITESYSNGSVSGTEHVGGLVGENYFGAYIDTSYSTSTVNGSWSVGGLVGYNRGTITTSYSTGDVSGESSGVGGLVGRNYGGNITTSYSTCTVSGRYYVGGLVGSNHDSITNCYSTGAVTGKERYIGGLVGWNQGIISTSYSTCTVSGRIYVGGLVGYDAWQGIITSSFWDIETSGQTESESGTGKTTAEMQTASTFLEAGWDFVGETENGIEDIWWIDEGNDYPRLWWELIEDDPTASADRWLTNYSN